MVPRIESLRQLENLCNVQSPETVYWHRATIAAAADLTNWKYGVPTRWSEAIQALNHYRSQLFDLFSTSKPYDDTLSSLEFDNQVAGANQIVTDEFNLFLQRWEPTHDRRDSNTQAQDEARQQLKDDFGGD